MATTWNARPVAILTLVVLCLGGLLVWGDVRDRGAASPTCPLPLAGWDTPQTGTWRGEFSNWVEVNGQDVLWNGSRINMAELREYVAAAEQITPPPQMLLALDGASNCAFATKVRSVVTAGSLCKESVCWQGSREAFARAGPNPNRQGLVW